MKKLFLFLGVIVLASTTLAAQDTIVAFKFDTIANSLTFGNAYNTNNVFLRDTTFKAGPAGFTYPAGVSTLSLSSTKWQGGLDSLKNYYTSFASTGYRNLTISSSQRSSTTGPRNFKLQYKVDFTGTWTDVTGGAINCNNATSFFSLTNVPLPAVCDSQDLVFLRWIMTSDTSVGGAALVASTGTSRMDNVFVLGTSLGTVDTDPPVVLYVNVIATDSLKVKFNEPVNQSIAENPANFTFPLIPGNSCISSTFYAPDVVHLKLSQNLPTSIPDTLSVNNMVDLTGNIMTIPQKFPVMFSVIDTLVYWGFADLDTIADAGISANLNKTINRQPGFAGAYSYDPGVTDNCLRTSSWASGNGSKYWMVSFTTRITNQTGYTALKLFSRQKSTNTGPRDFRVEYTLDTTTSWTPVAGTQTSSLNDNFVSGTIANISLPTACDMQSVVYLRWIMTSDSNAAGTALVTTGYNRIDDILITGIYSPDIIPPSVSNVLVLSCDTIEIVFDETVDPLTALDISNYACTGGHSIDEVIFGSTQSRVLLLIVPALNSETMETLSVSNVSDITGNVMATELLFDVTCQMGGIMETKDAANIVSVFPNPFTDEVSVTLNRSYMQSDMQIFVYNSLGKLVWFSEKNAGTTSQKIDMLGLNAGVYYLIVNCDNTIIGREKLIKMH